MSLRVQGHGERTPHEIENIGRNHMIKDLAC